jgi:hypothetical protein
LYIHLSAACWFPCFIWIFLHDDFDHNNRSKLTEHYIILYKIRLWKHCCQLYLYTVDHHCLMFFFISQLVYFLWHIKNRIGYIQIGVPYLKLYTILYDSEWLKPQHRWNTTRAGIKLNVLDCSKLCLFKLINGKYVIYGTAYPVTIIFCFFV